MTYCKGPQIIKYLSYVLGEGVFLSMVRNFINTFNGKSATFEDFLSMIEKSVVEADQAKDLKIKINYIKNDFLKNTCPPVFGYEIETDEKNNKIKRISIKEESMSGVSNSPSSLETDVMLVYLNKSSGYHEKKLPKVEITSEQSINNALKDVNSKPDFILLNCTDESYFIQKFNEEQLEWLYKNITVIYIILYFFLILFKF